jgi:hypothetical protein
MKDYGLCLPLLTLRNEEVTFKIKYSYFDTFFVSSGKKFGISLKSAVIKELIQLDTAEKSRFLSSQLTYLTENVSSVKITTARDNITSSFKLCKYLFLVGNSSSPGSSPVKLKFTGLNISVGGNLLYSGTSSTVPLEIFTKLNINKYFIGCGRDLADASDHSLGQLDSIAMIPFSIDPTNYTQPSGCVSTLGNSNNIILNLDVDDALEPDIELFAINYNILQISDGRAQLQNS